MLHLLNGDGVPQDATEAARWFRITAEKGHPLAQCNLASQYSQGRGVTQGEALERIIKGDMQDNRDGP